MPVCQIAIMASDCLGENIFKIEKIKHIFGLRFTFQMRIVYCKCAVADYCETKSKMPVCQIAIMGKNFKNSK